jgi:hypothetical protein
MRTLLTPLRWLALGLAAVVTLNAQAVCLDPRDLSIYYYPTLEQEINTSDAIVVGTVVHEQGLNQDKTDPEGWTSFIYTVRVTQVLRGHTLIDVALKASNDTSGYRMSTGQTHLLFLSRRGTFFTVDPCGNSKDLRKSETGIEQVKSLLQSKKYAP